MDTNLLYNAIKVTAGIILAVGCSSEPSLHLPPNSPSIQFVGNLPCGDCEGITTSVALSSEDTGHYDDAVFAQVYKGTVNGDVPEAEICKAYIHLDGDSLTVERKILTLFEDDSLYQKHFLMTDNSLILLDKNRNRIESFLSYELFRLKDLNSEK